VVYPLREDDPLGGRDPYSASKSAREMVIASFRDSYILNQGVAVGTARARNVIGGGDWSKYRLIPDAIRAWQSGEVLEIRRPNDIRPWQHVLEPLKGYLILIEKLWNKPTLARSYNFGPNSIEIFTVGDAVNKARVAYGNGLIRYEVNNSAPHETNCLLIETSKSKMLLGVHPRWNLDTAIARTMNWYLAQHLGSDAKLLYPADIVAYEHLSVDSNL
jgi:CDP-glucose 4,6-dehydratase